MKKDVKEFLKSIGCSITGSIGMHPVFGILDCNEKTTIKDVAQKIFERGRHAKAEEVRRVLYI